MAIGKKYLACVGVSYGYLTVKTAFQQHNGIRNMTRFKCLCKCGTTFDTLAHTVVSGKSASCGCARIEKITKHGFAPSTKPTRTYRSWISMRDRCDNPKSTHYDRYGGRGITYDPRWTDFREFLLDMGERPEDKTLDRINNNGNYCKDNCKWSTRKEQAANREATAAAKQSWANLTKIGIPNRFVKGKRNHYQLLRMSAVPAAGTGM